MAIPTVSLSEKSPAGGDNIALGDNRIREFKTQNREILEVDHDYPSTGQSDTAGQHKKVTLQEQADLGTGATGVPILGAQTIDDKPELVYTDEDDNDIQMTKAGKIKLSSGRLENNTNLTARNQAGDGDINLLKANTSNQAEVTPALLPSAGVILPEISAPTTAANQGGLYTKNDGDQTELYFREESNGDEVQITNDGSLNVTPTAFGSWVNKSSSYGAQQAATDGFVVVVGIVNAGGESIIGYTDASSNPTTARCQMTTDTAVDTNNYSFTMPVRKGDYWKVVLSGAATLTSIYWIPLGS
jgi:hypothetical protein